MQQTEQIQEPVVEQPKWEAPELIVSDVSTATQFNPTGGTDGSIGS